MTQLEKDAIKYLYREILDKKLSTDHIWNREDFDEDILDSLYRQGYLIPANMIGTQFMFSGFGYEEAKKMTLNNLAQDSHTWKKPYIYRSSGGTKHYCYQCSVCREERLEDIPKGIEVSSGVSGPYFVWDGKSTCEEVLATQRQNQIKSDQRMEEFRLRTEVQKARAEKLNYEPGYYWVLHEKKAYVASYCGGDKEDPNGNHWTIGDAGNDGEGYYRFFDFEKISKRIKPPKGFEQ